MRDPVIFISLAKKRFER